MRDGNGGAKLSLDHFVAAVLKIKYEYETGLRTNSCLLADSRGGNKSLKRIPYKRYVNFQFPPLIIRNPLSSGVAVALRATATPELSLALDRFVAAVEK